jgi:hypothetical protein
LLLFLIRMINMKRLAQQQCLFMLLVKSLPSFDVANVNTTQ